MWLYLVALFWANTVLMTRMWQFICFRTRQNVIVILKSFHLDWVVDFLGVYLSSYENLKYVNKICTEARKNKQKDGQCCQHSDYFIVVSVWYQSFLASQITTFDPSGFRQLKERPLKPTTSFPVVPAVIRLDEPHTSHPGPLHLARRVPLLGTRVWPPFNYFPQQLLKRTSHLDQAQIHDQIEHDPILWSRLEGSGGRLATDRLASDLHVRATPPHQSALSVSVFLETQKIFIVDTSRCCSTRPYKTCHKRNSWAQCAGSPRGSSWIRDYAGIKHRVVTRQC